MITDENLPEQVVLAMGKERFFLIRDDPTFSVVKAFEYAELEKVEEAKSEGLE